VEKETRQPIVRSVQRTLIKWVTTSFSLVCVHRILLVLVCSVTKVYEIQLQAASYSAGRLAHTEGVSAESQAARLLTLSATVAGATVRRQMVVLGTHGEILSS
jgi:hypothetical protein